jgi:uncharacterized protein GlcG (DUF336 family)
MAVAIEQARAAKISISCCVVDAGGQVVALDRMDGAPFHTIHSCSTKAVCSSSTKRKTSAKGAVGQTLDVAHALGLTLAAGAARWTAMEGGVPVLFDGECVGGVGDRSADRRNGRGIDRRQSGLSGEEMHREAKRPR